MTANREITFGPFRLDRANGRLLRDSRAVALRPKAFAVLEYLLERPGQLVTKQQLLDAVWPDTFVGDAVLKDSIRQLREALGDDVKSPLFIETAHRRGYRFIGDVVGPAPGAGAGREAETPPPPPGPTAEEAARAPSPPRVLGREAALERMRGWLGQALRAERQVVFVTGEPGIGKTSLAEAFAGQAAALHGVRVARGQCLEQYGAGEAYLPVLDALSRLGRGPGGERVVGLLRRHAPTWLAQMPSLVPAPERESLLKQSPGTTRERMLQEMAEAVEALTAEAPLVLVLEDLHWSDYSTLDLVSYLARRRDPARLMVVGTYRPVEVILSGHPLKGIKRELQAHSLCKELPLAYLTEETVAQYLAATFPRNQFPARLARLIHRRTEGNPLFMVNVVNYLRDEGVIAESEGGWRLRGGLAEVEPVVPENLKQLIERQVERLSPEEQRVLEGASVVGMECSAVAIAAGLASDPVHVEEVCEELARRHQFLSPPGLVELPDGTPTPRYKFTHVLYLEVPYCRIPATRRSQIHLRIGVCGESVYGARVSEIAAELAMHFEQGRDWPRAVRYLLLAAENATHRFAHHEAAQLARRGLGALRMLPEAADGRAEQELALQMILGVSLMTEKGFASAELDEVYRRARELCARPSASAQPFRVMWTLGLFYYFRAETATSLDIARRLVGMAEGLGDAALVMEARRAFGVSLVEAGDFNGSLKHLVLATALYKRNPRPPHFSFSGHDTRVICELFAARALWALGFPGQALGKVNAALEAAEALAHAETMIAAAYFAAHLHQLRREPARVGELAETVIALAKEHRLELWESCGVIQRGWARAETGSPAEGVAEMRRGLAAYAETGARLWRAHFLGLLAGALAKAGRAGEGLAAAEEALAAVGETGEGYAEPELHRVRGELLLGHGPDADRAAQAEDSFNRAVGAARERQAKSWELRAATNLARLYRRQGRVNEARNTLAGVLGWFTEGFDTADLREARGLSDELANL